MQHLLILVVGIIAVGLGFLVWRWPQDTSKSFSQHAAAHRAAAVYYFVLFTTVILLLAFFFFGYFIPTHHLSFAFSAAMCFALAGQFIAVLVPEVGGWKSQVHRTAAGWSAFGLFFATVSIVVGASLPALVFIFGILTIAAMLFCSALAFRDFLRRRPFQHRYFLWLQVVYYAMFFGFVGMVTYLG